MSRQKRINLYLVIPCYNEEDVLPETTKRIETLMNELYQKKWISKNSKVLYVNDGSQDHTWDLIKKYEQEKKWFSGISLSRNRGHQNALTAGLLVSQEKADAVISMDADLQDDISVIEEMLEKYHEGKDIVYGVRKSRKKDTVFKRITAHFFYKFMSLMGANVIYNHADFRLTSKKALQAFSSFKEVNLFLRGLFPLVGFESDIVYYDRNERFAGKSKYPLKKMLNFAWDGITSFSVKPIRLVFILGTFIFLLSIFMTIYFIIGKLLGNNVQGWTFIVCSIWLMGGIQMLSLGMIGEYIGKIYSETKQRPRYIISENLLEEVKS